MKAELTLEEAARYIGVSTEDLRLSRARGLSPGKLGYVREPFDGTVWFRTVDLVPARAISPNEVRAAEAVPLRCQECSNTYKTRSGLDRHVEAKHG